MGPSWLTPMVVRVLCTAEKRVWSAPEEPAQPTAALSNIPVSARFERWIVTLCTPAARRRIRVVEAPRARCYRTVPEP